MSSVAGYTQMGMRPAAGVASRACGQPSSLLAWQLADRADAPAMDATPAIATFVDVPKSHRHRRPLEAS
jgi:hypothetical protein